MMLEVWSEAIKDGVLYQNLEADYLNNAEARALYQLQSYYINRINCSKKQYEAYKRLNVFNIVNSTYLVDELNK